MADRLSEYLLVFVISISTNNPPIIALRSIDTPLTTTQEYSEKSLLFLIFQL